MEPFEEILEVAEARWLTPLFRHCRDLFSGVFLPSHDHLHHARVWSHARSLLSLLDESGTSIPESLAEQLIIAVFFHDTGLVRTHDEQHGRESRILCEEFFRGSRTGIQKPEPGAFRTLLHAIEHHDDKSLKSTATEYRPGYTPDLLSLLSVSDDLDAFGTIGIYRYAEIYLLRGIDPERLPHRVTKNVNNRFYNLKNTFTNSADFIRIQETRFRVVLDFYLRLSQAYASHDERPSWEPVLIEVFRDNLLHHQNILKTDRILPDTGFNAEIKAYFNSLDKENPVRNPDFRNN